MADKGKPRIFLCHAHDDKVRVRELYQQLKAAGYAPWLDQYDLLPGQNWRAEIMKIITDPHNLVVVCLSCNSTTKRGVVQQEIKWALDVLDQTPEGSIYLIPARLEECSPPERLADLHWVDLFEPDGFQALRRALDFEITRRQPPGKRSPSAPPAVLTRLKKWLRAAARDPMWQMIGALFAMAALAWAIYTFYNPWSDRVSDNTLTPGATIPTHTPTETSHPANTPAPTPTLGIGATKIRLADEMVMVYVPAGTFLMGSADSDPDAYGDEKSQHPVSLDAFWIDKYEVSNKQYTRCVTAGACQASVFADDATFNGAERPVVGVTWHNAADYCRWAGGRLPTEAEWEYVARGPDGRIYPWGDEFDGARLNYCDRNCKSDGKDADMDDGYPFTAPVSSFPDGASWAGALNMAGNVWEWTSSLDEDYPYQAEDGRENVGAEGPRVLRGGAFDDLAGLVRCAARGRYYPGRGSYYVGFRCVLAPGS